VSRIAGPVDLIPPGSAGSAPGERRGGPAPRGPSGTAPGLYPPDVTSPAAQAGVRPVDVLTAAAVTAVTPTVRRVTLTGTPDAVAAAGPTVHLLVPRVGDPTPQWPGIARDGRIVWPQGAHGVSLRSYTARRQDPDRGEVDVDFVLHGDGPAAAWASAAAPGAVLGIAGGAPLGARSAGWLLLVGDETALPAMARILAGAAADTRGVVLAEVTDAREEQPLDAPPGVAVRWLHRQDTPPGASDLLVAAVAALERPAGEDVFAWVAAESAAVRAIRADLRGRWGLSRAEHHAIGYWRRGRLMAPAG
jgi:NADPH-dependent ferric siderophore reductase